MAALESRRPARPHAEFCICQWPPRVRRTTRVECIFGRRGSASRRMFRATGRSRGHGTRPERRANLQSRAEWGRVKVLEKNLPNCVSIFSFVSLIYKNCSSARPIFFFTTSRPHTLTPIHGRNALFPRLVRTRDAQKLHSGCAGGDAFFLIVRSKRFCYLRTVELLTTISFQLSHYR
ncbi:hypothetical protein LZ30DRAFT_360568 [Colletotrichum cereale]|nr:hypothetical protein LZ30DRAFT_360568 [Colletotrichum cereale]